MKKKLLIILLCILLIPAGCRQKETVKESDRQEVSVTVVRTKDEYDPYRLLSDPVFRSGLEEKLGIRLNVSEVSYTEPFKEDVEIAFTGGLITPDSFWMVPMSSGYQIGRIYGTYNMQEPQYGRLGSMYYSFVFSDPKASGSAPVLVANLELLEKAGVSSSDFSPEAFHDLLKILAERCEIPLTVYGTPSEKGFAVVLNLFSLAPTDGHEFTMEGSSIEFDKVSDSARTYLGYIRELYLEKLIPPDCVIMNEYAARKLFLSGKTALAMFPNASDALDAIGLAEKSGIRAAAVPIPAPKGKLDSAVYSRPIGLISFDCSYRAELLAVYQELEQAVLDRSAGDPAEDLPKASLFTAVEGMTYQDPITDLIPEIGTLYNKHLLDLTVIAPYYTKILTGALPASAFDEMRARWYNEYSQIGDTPNAELSGWNILVIMNGWRYRALREQQR